MSEPVSKGAGAPAEPPLGDEARILVLAPVANDARLTVDFLTAAGLQASVCSSIAEMATRLRLGCGALLLAEEALADRELGLLVSELERQPSWSDPPIILITGTGAASRRSLRHVAALGTAGNVSIIERPARPETLVSSCEVALRSRRRQYEVRDLVAEREAMVASISDAFATVDHEWRYTFLNDKAEALAGRPREELLGHPIWESFPGGKEGVHSDRLRQAVAERKNLEFELYHPKLDRWLEVRAYPSPAGLSIFTTDITERREAREQLRESKAQLHFALESAQFGDWDLNLTDNTFRRSLRHDQAIGYDEPVEKWTFQTFLQHVHPEDRSEVATKYRAALDSDRPWRIECRVIWPNRTVHWIAAHGSIYQDAEGKTRRMLGIVMDITAQKAAEQALMEQSHALREADRRKDEFLAMLAHELRNPLAAISNAAAVLNAADAEDRSWATGVIKRQSGQLGHLIDDLLDVSRITTGKIRLRKTVIDLASILTRARDSAHRLLTERGHELITDYPVGELWVEADPTRVEQVILNLLTNAAKYTPAGGLIRIAASRLDGYIGISIHDNGIGIAPQRLPEMFQLFAQGERSIARSEGGLGIGLTIVQKLVEMHGGRVEAHSDGPNLGSSFTVYFPATTKTPPAVGQRTIEESPGCGPRHVLIVDDNVDTAQGMARLLRRAGHEVELAHDGLRALEGAREFNPDAVILDIGLPGMDGFEVARRLRLEPCCLGSTIIAVTGYGQPEDRQRALAAGCDHHLVKPVDLENLKELICTRRDERG
jgi:PAS domain S-box-containing protein